MSNKPNILRKSSELQRNIIIAILIILILFFSGLILYFLFSKNELKKTNRMPYLEIYGNNVVILNQNDPYVDFGYYAYDLEDGNITKNVGVQNNVDNTKPGIYEISYVVSDSGQQSAVKTRTVIVKSLNHSFDFKLKGSPAIYLKKGNNFTEPGYIANNNLNDTVKVLGQVDGNKEGIYTIYYVLEYNREVAILTRKVIVSASLGMVNLSEEDLKYISNYNIKELHSNYKIVPEHFTSKTKLILAFSMCQNEGTMDDREISSCLKNTLKLKDNEISHLTSYDLINGNIIYDDSNARWSVSYNNLLNHLEKNLENMSSSLKLALEDEENIYIFLSSNDMVYKYTFKKNEDKYIFTSIEIV